MTATPADAACLLVVAPHPDDDILGCAYLMQAAARRGGAIIVVWMTDGGASHGDRGAAARTALVATRHREALSGVAALGVTPVATHFLDYPDGELAAHEAAAVAVLQEIARHHAVDTLCVTNGDDGHPDHRASYRIAAEVSVARRFSYPVSGRYDGDGLAPPAGADIVTGTAAAKRAALRCHASQHEGGGARFPMAAAAIDRFCTAEVFLPFDSAR